MGYIPDAHDKFNAWQKQLVTGVLTDPATDTEVPPPPSSSDNPNYKAWGIPDGDVEELIDAQATYQPFYDKWSDEDARNRQVVENHKRERSAYEKFLRDFVAQWLRNNKKLDTGDKAGLGLTVPDTEPTARPPITTAPTVRATPAGGGRIKIECSVESDSSRASMHPDADIVELRYGLGEPPPESPAQAPNGFNSSRSNWALQIDILEQGKRFYGYARWANTSDASKSGPWTERFRVIVA